MIEIAARNFSDLYIQLSQRLMDSETEDDIRGRIVLKHIAASVIAPVFPHTDLVLKLSKCVPIDISKKIRYIKDTYYSGLIERYKQEKGSTLRFAETKVFWQPSKEDPCIAYVGLSRSDTPRNSGNELTVVFRASRLFPVLFLDLLALDEIAKELNIASVNFFFDTLFLQRETVLLDLIFKEFRQGSLFKRSVKIWKSQISRPDKEIKFGQTLKLKKFYNSIKEGMEE